MTSLPLPVLASSGYSALIQRPIDNTALASYMTCPKKFEYSMLLNRRGEGSQKPALSYGSAWHKALETHYRLGGYKADKERNHYAVEAAIAFSWEPHDKLDDHRTPQRVLIEYDKYVSRWGMPNEEDSRTVGWPDQPLVEIATELRWPAARHPYAGKIDRIITMNGLKFVEDHKTTSRWASNYFRQFELKNQMMGYAFMARLLTGDEISGVRINCHVVRKSDSQFERQIISFSKARLDDWAKNYNRWILRIETDLEVKAQLEQIGGDTDTAFIRNYDACDAKYGMCQYAGVCSTSPELRTRVLEQDFQLDPWNPLTADDDEAEV